MTAPEAQSRRPERWGSGMSDFYRTVTGAAGRDVLRRSTSAEEHFAGDVLRNVPSIIEYRQCVRFYCTHIMPIYVNVS